METHTKIKSKAKEIQNLFWKEVLNSLAFYREKIEVLTEEESLPHTVIWSSGLIQNNNLLIKPNIYMSSGLMYLSDLYNFDTKEFKTREQWSNIHNINISAFGHMCLMQSIPLKYKNIIQKCNSTTIKQFPQLVFNLCSKTKALRYIYTKIIQKLPYEIKSKPKWEQAFRTNIEYTDWNKFFTLPKKTTIDSQTRIFQYKILHRILPTNDLLHRYNLRDNPMCEQCPVTIDTLEHTFHLCPRIKQVWYDMADWLFPEIDLFQYINSENIIVGIYKEN